MTLYDVNQIGWPPDATSIGGLGLYLDAKGLAKAREVDAAESPDYLPAIKTSLVTDPKDTALLVERISLLNALWGPKCALTASASEQFEARTFEAKDFHGGKMNYLMLDGHVELQSPHMPWLNGLWTIRVGD